MASRVSRVALPRWGSRTALGVANQAGFTSGSPS